MRAKEALEFKHSASKADGKRVLFRLLFLIPLAALIGVVGVWYAQRPDTPNPIAAAEDAAIYIEVEVRSIGSWAPEPGWGGYYAEGFDEVSVTLLRAPVLFEPDSFTGRSFSHFEAGDGFLVRTQDDGFVEGGLYALLLRPGAENDPIPLWIAYAHDLEADAPAPSFAEVKGSDGRSAMDVLDCLVDETGEMTRLGSLRRALVDDRTQPDRAAVLELCA